MTHSHVLLWLYGLFVMYVFVVFVFPFLFGRGRGWGDACPFFLLFLLFSVFKPLRRCFRSMVTEGLTPVAPVVSKVQNLRAC